MNYFITFFDFDWSKSYENLNVDKNIFIKILMEI